VLSPEKDGQAKFIEDYSVSARTEEIKLLLPRGLQGITGGKGEF